MLPYGQQESHFDVAPKGATSHLNIALRATRVPFRCCPKGAKSHLNITSMATINKRYVDTRAYAGGVA